MKKVLLLIVALTLVLGVASLGARENGQPGLLDTPHDVQVISGEAGLEPCAMCHTPHSGTGDFPIWNRDQGAQTYTMYDSPSFDMNDHNPGPQAPSSLCLVCHNGVFSSLVNYPGPGSHGNENYDFQMNPTFWAMLDTDLSNEHPISFTYDPTKDSSQDNNGFPQQTTCPDATWRQWIVTTVGTFPLYGSGTTANPTDQFECATCHAVHDSVAYPGKQLVGGKSVGSQVFFLRGDNSGSKMCAACHVNKL
jgi:hypothetical protein